MANNKKKPNQQQKPRIEAPAAEASTIEVATTVADLSKVINSAKNPKHSGLDANHRVDLAMLNHKIFGEDPNAAEKYGEHVVESMNHITAIMAITETVTEGVLGESPFAITVKTAYLPDLTKIATAINMPLNQKMLPAPVKDENGEETVTVPGDAFTPSEEVKKEIKKEGEIRKANENSPEFSPLDIKSEDDLRNALEAILNKSMSPFKNITEAVNFYSAYLKVQASKDKKEDDKSEIAVPAFTEMLESILSIVNVVPFCIRKIADNMCTTTGIAKSVIPAFCTMRDASKNRKTGVPSIDDPTVAGIVKVLVKYSATHKIAEYQKNLDVLSKDTEKNATAIENCNNSITYLNNIIATVNNPSAESIENLIAQYENKNDENHNNASRSFNQIIRTFYGNIDTKGVKQDILKNNVKQYAGIITNLFRDSLGQIVGYNESNILELVTNEQAAAAEEKKS